MGHRPEADIIELTLPARADYVSIARLTVSGVANRMGFGYEEIEDIKLAVAEACTNVVEHAYDCEVGLEQHFRVRCLLQSDRLVVEVIDQGKGFGFDEQRESLKPIRSDVDIDEVAEGGLGLYLIHSVMDDVRVHVKDGVVVSMTKYLRRDEVSSNDQSSSKTES
ncbi:anti-sigma B factor RsbW [Brevibacillus ruminantium]|uniref:Anti-sigma B factor RsbW n=1 Tax=Brevibacillus ruminantium TaxID=2950604 RepID=A0ABY4WLU8_9BACL|nr:anti-sigma B factor RsbW [Brevibacillus ruminantium]USG66349.1 anti-sigma B factor RsbW [Brevibacillus ruminantium]